MYRIYSLLFFLVAATLHPALAQQDTLVQSVLAVVGRSYNDSITLRWAPRNAQAWQQGNTQGYRIERITRIRNGAVLPTPEKVVLHAQIKPLPLDNWEALVKVNRYAAIAAQALYGDRFEVDLSKSDLFSIVNKVKENEQRYAFALFSADMSPAVARASGLWFTDKSVKKGEKYVYRIVLNNAQDIQSGSLFISAGEGQLLPAPQQLQAEIKGNQISLRWEKAGINAYTAYIVERSTDGKLFEQLSEVPLITLTPEDKINNVYEYATDSLVQAVQTAYYRVRGITPFGESGLYSAVVKVTAGKALSEVPYIKESTSTDNKSVVLHWDFPKEQEASIKGFNVERSTKPQGNFSMLTPSLSPTLRSYEDKTPQQVNYYRVTAVGKDGTKIVSPLHLAMLVDSIPPATPAGLKALVSDAGHVTLSWNQNSEKDVYGYRIYKANTEKEEATQLTPAPIGENTYTDTVNLKALSEVMYYGVMAIDKNQNHSPMSALLKVVLPDKIKPQPPSMFPVRSNEKGTLLSWTRSSSSDVVQYDVYRRGADRSEWQRIKIVTANPGDTTYSWTDEYSTGIQHYSITAVDDSGLESEPTMPVRGGKIDNGLQETVSWKTPLLVKEEQYVLLHWQYEKNGVRAFKLFRAADNSALVLHKTLSGGQRDYREHIESGKKYTYRIMAVFDNEKQSELSKELTVENN